MVLLVTAQSAQEPQEAGNCEYHLHRASAGRNPELVNPQVRVLVRSGASKLSQSIVRELELHVLKCINLGREQQSCKNI